MAIMSMMRSAAVVALVSFASIVFTAAAGRAPAQAGRGAAPAKAPAGQAPRMPDGHPDLSGVWWRGSDIGVRPLGASPAPGGARRFTAGGRAPSVRYQPVSAVGGREEKVSW
jgi:hypothetical protein